MALKRINKIIEQLQPYCSNTRSHNKCDNSISFEYSQSNGILTVKQREFYEKNGYIVIKKVLNKQQVSKFYNRFDELVSNPSERPPNLIVMRDVSLKQLNKNSVKDEKIVSKLQNWSRDKILWQYAINSEIIKYVSSIIGSDIVGFHFMEINKPSDTGQLTSRHPLHQDQYAFTFGPSKYICCSWTALQKIDRNNGCLVVIPGSHKIKNGLLPHSYPKQWNGAINKMYHGIEYDGDINILLRKRIHLEMDKGDTVFFHPLLIHGSGANLSDRNRRSISVHYGNSKLLKFIEPPKYIIPQQCIIAKEIEETIKKVLGINIKYNDYWKQKSRQVKGDRGEWKL